MTDPAEIWQSFALAALAGGSDVEEAQSVAEAMTAAYLKRWRHTLFEESDADYMDAVRQYDHYSN